MSEWIVIILYKVYNKIVLETFYYPSLFIFITFQFLNSMHV